MEVPKVKDWLPPPRKRAGHGVLARAHLPLPPTRTHQVDNGDAEQAAYSQDGQGQPQQGVRLHPLRDGTERRPPWAAPLWNHRVQSPGSSPRQGGAPAGGPGWGWGAHSPKAPQMGQLLPGSSTLLGSWQVLCPELRTRCSDKRDTPTLGATHSRSRLGAPGRPGKAEGSGEASGALSECSPGRRGRGSDGHSSAGWVPGAGARGLYLHGPKPRWAPPTLTKNRSAKHRPSTSPSTQATSPKDTPRAVVLERRETPKFWGISARGYATDMRSQHPILRHMVTFCPSPPKLLFYTQQGGRGAGL